MDFVFFGRFISTDNETDSQLHRYHSKNTYYSEIANISKPIVDEFVN